MGHASILVIAAVAALVGLIYVPTAGADPCVFTNGTFYSYQSVMDCFRSVPWNETVKQMTITSLQKTMELYAFLDIASNPPDQEHFSPPVDLISQLETVRNTYYETDYDFHVAIRNIYIQLHDAHTMYYAPACYASFTFFQPFSPVSFVNEQGNQVIVVSRFFHEDVKQFYLTQGMNLTEYVDATLLEINGVDAVEYMVSFANNYVGSAKDPATRYNIALGIPTPFNAAYGNVWLGLFSNRIPHFLPAPTEDSVNYLIKFSNGTTSGFTFPWIVSTNQAYTGLNSFLAAYYNPDLHQTKSAPRVQHQQKTEEKKEPYRPSARETLLQRIDVKKLHSIYEQKLTADAPFKPITNTTTSGVGVYQADGRTLVLYINTFLPTDYFAFEAAIVEGMFYANFYGLDRLILDLTLNGGGDICLGRSMLRFLFPEGPNFGPTDLPSSPLARNLTRTAAQYNITDTDWSPNFYQSQNGSHWANNDTSWLIPGIPHQRGGRVRNYSQLVHIGSNEGDCGRFPITDLKPFDPKKVLLVTHGFCGSTCALFANHVHQYYGVKTIVVGGLQNQTQQQYTSFPGLEVLETPSFYDELDQLLQNTRDLSCTSCYAPRRLLTTGGFRFCDREIYGPINNYTLPLEYTFQPADIHIDNTRVTAQNPEFVWSQVLQYFPQ